MVGPVLGREHAYLVVAYGGGQPVMKNFNDPTEADIHVAGLNPGDNVLYHGPSDADARAVLDGIVVASIPRAMEQRQRFKNIQTRTMEHDIADIDAIVLGAMCEYIVEP